MPLRLDVKRKLTARSDRVKSVDLHPTEPWMLASLYNGNVHVWHIESQQLVKSFEVCDLPVRAARFVARKNWVVTGSDDMQVRVFNYNTLERIHQFEAHSDYVRCIAVHPTQPFLLTCSDDMTIKLWNWDKKWSCQQIFEGHSHYVMQIVINPKDNNTFASASLDRTVKVWQLGSPQPNFTLEGHQRGVNCVDYYHGGDKPYLISGADDCLVKIWDYQNKTCVQTLEGHSQNVSCVCFHPELPIILTGSEDCTVRIWHANTYRLENTLNYGLDRVWCITALKGINNVCFGYDEGSVMVKLGREEPAMSMDVSGKIVWAKHAEIQQANLKAMGETEISDGERLPLALKDLGACDIYPQTIAHNPNGRFVVVCGDGEYIIYTAMALRNKAFGPALEFVWALDSSEYAIRESNFTVKLFKNFKEKKVFKPDFGCEGIFGGYLLGCRSSATGLAFYDWETQELVRRIEIQPRQVFWSENGDYVCIATDDNYFILKYSCDAVTRARETKEGVSEDGVEDAFDVVSEVQETVKTGRWVGDCFIYTNSVNRLNYYVGGEIVTVAHLDRTLYLLGYIPKDNRLYLGDKELNVVSYELLLSVLEYQTAVMRRDFETADRVLPTIPPAHRTRVAHFLEKQGFKQQALAVSTDPEHRFDLALNLSELEVCYKLASEAGSEHKWRLVADLAQQRGDLEMAQACLLKAHDYPGLLLQATSSGNGKLIQEVGVEAETQGRNNVAFLSYFITGQLHKCLELLLNTKRVPEAAFFARTYMPSEMSRVVQIWKDSVGGKIGQSLADPDQYDNLFPGLQNSLKTEQFHAQQRKTKMPSVSAASTPLNHERNAIEEMLKAETAGAFVYVPPVKEGDDAEFVDAPQQPTQPEAEAKEVNLLEDEDLITSIANKPALAVPEEPVLVPSVDTPPAEQEPALPPPVEEICPPPVQVPEALATTPVVVHEEEDLIKDPATPLVVDEDDDLKRDPVSSLVVGEGNDLGKVAAPSLVVDEDDEIRKDHASSSGVEEDDLGKDSIPSLGVDEEDDLGKDPTPSLVVDEDNELWKDPAPPIVVDEDDELRKECAPSFVVDEEEELRKGPTSLLVVEDDKTAKDSGPSLLVEESPTKEPALSLDVEDDLWKEAAPPVVVSEEDDLVGGPAPPTVAEDDLLRSCVPPAVAEGDIFRSPAPPTLAEADILKNPASPILAESHIIKDPLASTHNKEDVNIRAENQFLEDDWGSDDGLECDGSKIPKEEGQGSSVGKLGEFQGSAPHPSSRDLKMDHRLEEEQLIEEEEDMWGAEEDLLEEDLLKEEKVSESLLGASSGMPSIDSAQLERELELDLKNVRLEDHLDTADVNLDEEDLLAD